MKNLKSIFSLLCMLLPVWLIAQQKKTAKNIDQIKFTEVWVWEYTDNDGKKIEMAIYREPKLNYWLLTTEAYGNTDDMCDWILIKPDGNCYFAYKNAELNGGGSLLKMKLPLTKIKSLPAHWKPTNKLKNFGNNTLGFPVLKGKEYKVNYIKTKEQSTFYLTTYKANIGILNTFNELDADARLPIRFPKDIPENYVVLSENSFGNNYSISYQFKYISHAEYFIKLSDYKANP